MIAGPPRGDVSIPSSVAELAGGGSVRVVWVNELGGVTFDMGSGPRRTFVKWAPAGSGLDLGAEAVRLEWASAFSPVPRVLEQGSDAQGSWIVTSPIPGESAVADRWKRDPATAVRALGTGLRALHDTLPVAPCPFSWSATDRVADARRRAAMGAVDPARWHEQHRDLAIDEAFALLGDPPPTSRLVVCHGDACAPNTLLDDHGDWTGHVDLGALGTADRWSDLAIATWSCDWNYGPGWQDALLDAYGIGADALRTRYYRLLWDLGP